MNKYFKLSVPDNVLIGFGSSMKQVIWEFAHTEWLEKIEARYNYLSIEDVEDFDLENARIEGKTIEEYFKDYDSESDTIIIECDFDYIAASLNALDMKLTFK